MIKLFSDTPWYIYFLCLAAGIGLSYLLYSRRNDNISGKLHKLLFIIRSSAITLICLLLTNIFLKHYANRTEKPLIILAVDNSGSLMATKDSMSYKLNITERITEIKNKLGDNYDVQTILFGEKTRKSDSLDFSDKQTDLGQLFESVNNNYAGSNTGAMILLSDGIYNKGSDPAFMTEKINFPVYTIALGDTSTRKDAWISKINHNQVSYLGNRFTAEAVIKASRLNGKNLKVSFLKNKQLLSEQSIRINSDNFITNLIFNAEADVPGVQKYDIIIERDPEEENMRNNSMSFILEVIDNRDKILLLAEAPHPDVAAVANAIESMKNYELVKDLSNTKGAELKSFHLVILHGVSPEHKRIIESCKVNKIPYWVILTSYNGDLNELRISNTIDKTNDSEPVINNTFGLFSVSDELKKLIADLPAVKTPFGKYTLSNNAQTLLQQKIGSVNTGDPLLFFTDQNDQKTAVFIGDGLWKWRLRNYQETKNFNAFHELISKSIQFLAVKSDKSFFRIFTEKIIFENERVELRAEVYNKSYELITEPDVNLILKNSEGKTFTYTFSKQTNQYTLNLGFLPPGEYTYEAGTKIINELHSKKGIIVVKPLLSEKINNTANHRLLELLSLKTGGKKFLLNETDQLTDIIKRNENIKPVTYSQNETSDLIDLKWLFAIIISLFTAEWFIRKYSGAI